ncbi:membrane protein insertase YidC [Nocardia sp. CDC159]|uniref:Membrane protein insertase YidC n=1 Tax=Nocardia pulmonis TaxID=2951408 RepID=A0A9X2E5U4_9NOCA|nr:MULTISPECIES: membrane protein insertase YidC [Nocardia]MCM6774201.1 membrane protein insertase YidC [Nocardia pulmonis]MCM6787088.1 membrane protein insertase YidC [Nocardia sp. CDC159]
MLDFIYYPVSAILWFWHRIFGFVLGPDSGLAWALAVVFLVFTLRALLVRPALRQLRTARQLQELQPRIRALRKRFPDDLQRQAVEMRKIQRENGFNPFLAFLPALVQAPVFIGLLHVLKSFNRTGTGFGGLGMSPETNAHTPNYVFGVGDVQSFLGARLFGAPISAAITTPHPTLASFAQFGGIPSTTTIAAVAIPLMLLAALATHFNARASIARQRRAAEPNPQAELMNRLLLWVFPLGALLAGPVLMIAVLLYWVGNNLWTYGQQHLIYARLDREDIAKQVAAAERRAAAAPKPGARPAARRQSGRRRGKAGRG